MVDDDPDVRAAYRAMFARSPEVELVGDVSDGSLAAAAYERYSPDVVLMDIQMPLVSGIDATREITTRWRDAVVVASTTFGAREYVVAALRAGAAGYLLKDVAPDVIIEGILRAAGGDMFLAPDLADRVLKGMRNPLPKLTEREVEVLRLLATGASNKEMARALFVTEATVKSHIAHIFTKLNVDSRSRAIHLAQETGLI